MQRKQGRFLSPSVPTIQSRPARSDLPQPGLWHSFEDPEYRRWLVRACSYEFIGTLILIYIQAASGETLLRLGTPAFANDALGHGLAALVATYICVHVSGAMFNPAMTLGFWLSRRIDAVTMGGFILAQVSGSIAAAGLLRASLRSLTLGLGVPRLVNGLSLGGGLLITSILGVFMFWFFAMTFLRGRYFFYRNRYRMHGASPTYPTHSALLAFGWNGAVEAAFVNTIGSGPNPVRWLGPAIIAGRYNNWVVWICGPFIGVLIGVALYGLDAALFRPDRTRIDAWQQQQAARKQGERQGTRPHSSQAPPPPGRLPEFFDDLEREFMVL